MKFSVLMSIYRNDNPDYLRLALESIYEDQTRKPNEVVIVYDGPLTKALYATVESWKKDKLDVVTIVKLKENSGLGIALKTGSQYCKYEYILRMDSDDISNPKRFEIQLAYVELHPEIDCLGSYISEFVEQPCENMRIRIVPESHVDIVSMGKKRNPMNHVSVCIKKDALMKCGNYEDLKLLEDYYLWLKMIVYGCKLANIPETLVYVRIGNGFNRKRGSKERIAGWQKLQNYMVMNRLISKTQSCQNMMYIKIFVGMPEWIRKIAYAKILRK